MNRVYHFISVYLLFSFLIACSSDENASVGFNIIPESKAITFHPAKLSVPQYLQYVRSPENGLIASKKIEGLTFELLYRPLDYIVAEESDKSDLSKTELSKGMEGRESLQYFTFRISCESNTEFLRYNLNSIQDYYARIEYYTSNMQRDLHLVDGSDTMECVLFHYERVYNVAPYATFSCAFPRVLNNKDERTMSNDKIFIYKESIFNTGNVCLTIEKESFAKLPELELNN